MSVVRPWRMVGLSVLVGLSVVTGAEHEPVDQFGDLSKLIIHGAEAFAPHRLRDALRSDFVTIVAAHPRAPLESLPKVVQERLLAGYQQAGHVDARVEVRIDRAQHCLEAVIDEGPIYLCGDVRIEGAVSIDVAQLIERLTRPYVPEKAVKPVFTGPLERRTVQWLDRHGREVALEKAVWSPGEPAPMSAAGLNDLYEEVQTALEDLGFRASRFQVARVVDRAARTVELVVALIDEGPPTLIDDIEIVGAIRNGRQAILDYLDLRPGTLLTRCERSRLEFALWSSGRFFDFKLEPDVPHAGESSARLRLTLTESPHAPGLDQPLTREQQTLLRLREWLANEDGWQADFSFSIADQASQLEVILSPSQGVSAWYRPKSADGSPDESASLALLVTGETMALLLPGYGQRFEIPRLYEQITVTLSLGLSHNPEEVDKCFLIWFGLGESSNKDQQHEAPLRLCLNICPAVAVALPMFQQAQSAWEGDVLTLRFRNDSIVVDAKTGRLLRLCGGSEQDSFRGEFREGMFGSEADPVFRQRETTVNLFQADRPVSSLLMALSDERWLHSVVTLWGWSDPENDPKSWQLASWRLVRRLIELDILQPIDHLFARDDGRDDVQDDSQDGPRFTIPHDDISIPDDHLLRAWVTAWAAWAVVLTDGLFPRETWPWIVSRETGLTLVGKGSYTTEELRRMFYSNEAGPVSHLVIAWLLRSVKPGMTSLFAERGLTLLEVDFFRHDYRPLLDGNYLAGRCLLRVGEILRELEPEEVRQLTNELPEAWRTSIVTLVDHLHQQQDEPIETALSNALDASWKEGWSTLVARELSRLRIE